MGFRSNLSDARTLCLEIVHFEAYPLGYYAILRRGDRIDIKRAFGFQPEIADPSDFHAFMFVETVQGFFVLRQHVVENRPRPWEVWLELVPENPAAFFAQAYAYWQKTRRSQDGPPTR